MPPVIQVGDQMDLVPTKLYPHGKFPFEYFNPVQSRIFEYYDKPCSLVVASATSSGKTTVAELVMAYEVRVKKKKALFLAPLRSLSQEKYDDWTDKEHHFSDLNVSICTGDYRLTKKRAQELDKADVIVMSSEMLNHRARNMKSEQSKFLLDLGVVCVDEFHTVGEPGRGSHIESGLMKLTEINPNCRLNLLSATLPNVDEMADWVSYILTKKDTVLLTSTYRPCPLNLHYEKYWDGEQSYDANEQQKVDLALQIVKYYPEDKFLIFVHTKKTGKMMLAALKNAKIHGEFHNADLEKAQRVALEQKFKNDLEFRVVVATSTLSAGINMPARRVIVTGVHCGMKEVPTSKVGQMVGRAGRPAYDLVGDAYILLPERTYNEQKARLKNPEPILSQMLDTLGEKHKDLAFHLVSEINEGNIKDRDGVYYWYKRSLACFQAQEFDDAIIEGVLDLLKKCGAIWEDNGFLTVTTIGKISSLFYYSPFDVSDLKRNFNYLFDNNREDNDYYLSMALGNIDTQRVNIVSRAEREEMSRFAKEIGELQIQTVEPAIKAGYAYWLLLNGKSSEHFAGVTRGLQFDFPRLIQVLQALDGFTGKWKQKEWLHRLQLRVAYGVKSHLVYLCQIPQVGKVRATKLWTAGIRSVQDVINNPDKVKSCLGLKGKIMEEILNGAKLL